MKKLVHPLAISSPLIAFWSHLRHLRTLEREQDVVLSTFRVGRDKMLALGNLRILNGQLASHLALIRDRSRTRRAELRFLMLLLARVLDEMGTSSTEETPMNGQVQLILNHYTQPFLDGSSLSSLAVLSDRGI
jgi:hypothetical protein